jgi:hypothetical protein
MCTGNVAMHTLFRQMFEQQSEEEEQEAPSVLQGEEYDVHTPFTQLRVTSQQSERKEQTPPKPLQASGCSRFPTLSDFIGMDAPREIKTKVKTIDVLKNFIFSTVLISRVLEVPSSRLLYHASGVNENAAVSEIRLWRCAIYRAGVYFQDLPSHESSKLACRIIWNAALISYYIFPYLSPYYIFL